MKRNKPWWAALCLIILVLAGVTYSARMFFTEDDPMLLALNSGGTVKDPAHCAPAKEPECVMKTLFGLDTKAPQLIPVDRQQLSAEAKAAIFSGLNWILKAQQEDGGWGSGSHAYQDVRDPHKVQADPATTALVSMALLRTGNTLSAGTYTKALKQGTLFLLQAVEKWSADQPYLTTLSGTQPQTKLGANIDAILTVQFFTNLLKYETQHEWNGRIRSALDKCVQRIQNEQDENGSWKGGGWAPVLQSALADNALESAKDIGVSVDSNVLARSKKYQKGNYDTATRSAVTGSAAGIMLYSLSSTNRASAKEAKKAKDIFLKAKKEGKVKQDAFLNEVELQNAGVTPAEAKELYAAVNINEGTYRQATRDDIMTGFGNNGGEEFLSYLMTGESVLLQGGDAWKQWFDMMSKKLISIQTGDGSWQGHHCITSPVFCTATCLLILSIQNDLEIKPGV